MSFWKPGSAPPKHAAPMRGDGDGVLVTSALNAERQRLPAMAARRHFLALVERYGVVVIVGETGSGKTTQLPQFLLEAGWAQHGFMVACTQPRRVAATTVAARVAAERRCVLGGQVGYAVRFDERWSPEQTQIKFLTDGMLVREIMLDPLLSRYSVVMVDEAHERSLQTDILLGLLKKIRRKRPQLRVVVASATLDAEAFRNFFNTNPTLEAPCGSTSPIRYDPQQDTAVILPIQGRMFPIDIHYLERPTSDYVRSAVDTVVAIHQREPPGDVLVFLTGQDEIEAVCEQLTERMAVTTRGVRCLVLPMYAGLSHADQMRVFAPTPPRCRKVVVATNVAETSITVDGIQYVVDCGFVKMRAYEPLSGVESLVVAPTSRASAQQRAGRAGRTRPGKAYRLYPAEVYTREMAAQTTPEMQRSNLLQVILLLKALGIDNVLRFDYLSPPSADALGRALEVLYALRCIDVDARLTRPLGMQTAEFPIEPRLAKMLLVSASYGCSNEALTIAAMLSVESIWNMPWGRSHKAARARKRLGVLEGDHLTLLNVFRTFMANRERAKSWCNQHYVDARAMARAVEVRKQLRAFLRRFNVPLQSLGPGDEHVVAIRKCIVEAFFTNAARRDPDGSYRSVRGDRVLAIHPSSVLHDCAPDWVVFHEVVLTTKEYMRDVTVIEPGWLADCAPHYYEFRRIARHSEAAIAPGALESEHPRFRGAFRPDDGESANGLQK